MMNGVDLFLLGRVLMRIGESSLPEPPGGLARYPGSTRAVLLVAADIAEHADSTVGQIVDRTGMAQSQVSTAIARLKEAGAIETATDPADRRRTRIRRASGPTERLTEVRSSSIEAVLADELGHDDPTHVRRVAALLEELSRALLPDRAP